MARLYGQIRLFPTELMTRTMFAMQQDAQTAKTMRQVYIVKLEQEWCR